MLKIKMKTLGANQRSIDKTVDVTEQFQYNINAMSGIQAMTAKENINKGIITWSMPNSKR